METTATRSARRAIARLGWAARIASATFARRTGLTARRSLPRLEDVHPRAALATRRWRGVVTVPVADIVGTASYQAGSRRNDFQPAAGFEPADWPARWGRLEEAARSLAPLPPIELLKTHDGYWVVDGHNRVALAKSTGQRWIDADVTELRLQASSEPMALAKGRSE
jgi:hypothetical protein